jgi:hypothetical protein
MPRQVDLIDPIDSVTTSELKPFNGTPDYEKMFIFAELIGKRRERSVITLSNGSVSLETRLSSENVNMMGVDYSNSPTQNPTLSTKWTDNVSGGQRILEGFGINDIKVDINSSFIPRVTIDFIDIRGQVFFNQNEISPYALLFDFPPPIFKMTLKGYYGRALDYDLHLVKHFTKFDSNTGNYNISVEFIARTFAPLTDIPFKFIETFPLVQSNATFASLDPNSQEQVLGSADGVVSDEVNYSKKLRPKNTYELIVKLRSLNDALTNIRETSEESEAFNDAKDDLSEVELLISKLNGFSNQLPNDLQGSSEIIIKDNSPQISRSTDTVNNNSGDIGGDFITINTLSRYDDVIRSEENSSSNAKTRNKRLYIGILSSSSRNNNIDTVNTKIDRIRNELSILKTNFIEEGEDFSNTNISENDISDPQIVFNNSPDNATSDSDFDEYYVLDITSFYDKLVKLREVKSNDLKETKSTLVGKINNTVVEALGMRPTIYNIFEIICNDVDTFFKVLGGRAYDAEEHHNQFFDLIIDDVKESKSKIKTKRLNAFPLYTKLQSTNDCGGIQREVRSYPQDLSDKLSRPFPEITLVDDIIDTFIKIKKAERLIDAKNREDGSGNNQWIPISPADSELVISDGNYSSPYKDVEFRNDEPNAINTIYSIILNRFYVASQYAFSKNFYNFSTNNDFDVKYEDIVVLLAEAEAVNLANSVINASTNNSLVDKSKQFAGNPNLFYQTLQSENIKNFTVVSPRLNGGTNEFMRLNNDLGDDLYRNRTNGEYIGVKILRQSQIPSERVEAVNGSNTLDPVDKFLFSDDTSFWTDILDFFGLDDLIGETDANAIKRFTKENVPFFDDVDPDSDFQTRFLTPIINSNSNIPLNTAAFAGTEKFQISGSWSNTWYETLSRYDAEAGALFSGNTYSNTAKAFLIVSNFFRSRSYFSSQGTGRADNKYNINQTFSFPSVILVPQFSVLYMGALVAYYENIQNNLGGSLVNEIDNLIQEDWIGDISYDGIFFNEEKSLVSNLSLRDRETFLNEFTEFIEDDLSSILDSINDSIENVNEIFELQQESREAPENASYLERLRAFGQRALDTLLINDPVARKKDLYEESINSGDLSRVRENQFAQNAILNLSDITFSLNQDFEGVYSPLSVTNTNTNLQSRNNLFFNTFWERLSKELDRVEEELNDLEKELNQTIGDEDIKGNLYYTIKSISDKWVSGIPNIKQKGFPLNNDNGDRLIDKFAFVDRAMNPIGTTAIINAETLIEMSEDFDLNVFTVLSRLLSLNGFEFFPLQNFMVFSDDESNWSDAFKIFETANQPATPAFVCMYIGGTSTTLNSEFSDFDDDGVVDLFDTDLKDFNSSDDCNSNPEVRDSQRRTRMPGEAEFRYSEPKAFRVRFGEQNQSFFKDIQLEGREFSETAESLAILSRIAGDDSVSSPVPKGQNMFNVYENRAYSVRVTMLGNVMIQPTQYFQLENIPMYSGAYVITNVSHRVSENNMITEFEGVRILKYPNPYVTEYATIVGIESGTSDDLSGNPDSERLSTSSASNLPDPQTQYYNSMFTLKLSP